jgi:hypothetical protein
VIGSFLAASENVDFSAIATDGGPVLALFELEYCRARSYALSNVDASISQSALNQKRRKAF